MTSDSLDVRERELAADFDRDKLLNQFRGAYRRAPYFAQTFPLLERSRAPRRAQSVSLSSITPSRATCELPRHRTEIRISSDIAIDHDLKNAGQGARAVRGASAPTRTSTPSEASELYQREDVSDAGNRAEIHQDRSRSSIRSSAPRSCLAVDRRCTDVQSARDGPRLHRDHYELI